MAVAALALAIGTAQAQMVRVITPNPKDVRESIHLGHKLRREGLTPGQAEAEFWRAAWKHFPNDRFFARCFAAEAERNTTEAVSILSFHATTHCLTF